MLERVDAEKRNKTSKITINTQNLVKIGVIQSDIEKIISSFEILTVTLNKCKIDPSLFDELAKQAFDLINHAGVLFSTCEKNSINIKSCCQSIREITSCYSSLYPLFATLFFNLSKKEKTSKLAHSIFMIFIVPMIPGFAKATDSAYVSRYFGKLSFISLKSDDFKLMQKIKFDDSLDIVIENKNGSYGRLIDLELYAKGVAYLQADSNQSQTKAEIKFSPTLTIVSKATAGKFSGHNRSEGISAMEFQLACVNINKNPKEMVHSLIHEIQHIYNYLYFPEEKYHSNIAEVLSKNNGDKFSKLIYSSSTIKSESKIIKKILKEINYLLYHIADNYKTPSIDEISCFMTSLFLTYSAQDIRTAIDLGLLACEKTKNASVALSMMQVVDTAFSFIEDALIKFSAILFELTLSNINSSLADILPKKSLELITAYSEYQYTRFPAETLPTRLFEVKESELKTSSIGFFSSITRNISSSSQKEQQESNNNCRIS
jgi:hypothetical protein